MRLPLVSLLKTFFGPRLTLLAARVVGAPLATEGETVPTTVPVTIGTSTGMTTGTSDTPTGITGEMPQSSALEPNAGLTNRDTAPKANKRGSIFGNFFNKKDLSSPTTEAAPAVPVKDVSIKESAVKDETALTSSTAPKLEDSVSSPTAGATMTSTGATANDAVTSPVASPTTPETSKPQRRSSFFNNLGSRRERRSEAVSDAEGTDGEGKKSTTSKFGGLFRKPSRATPTTNTKTEPTTPGKSIVNDTTDAPALISKEEPAMTNGHDIVLETASKTEAQPNLVQASA